MDLYAMLNDLIAASVFALLGLVVLVIAMVLLDRLTPGDLWHKIMHEHNNAAAIVAGAVIVAVGLIIAAAIHG